MRVYLPSTLPLLRTWLAVGSVPVSTGYAVTAGLRAQLIGDEEELEHAAVLRAARASLRLLEQVDEPRRVVLAVEADAPTLLDHLDDGAVRLTAPLPLRAIAAGMVDGAEAADAVRRAADVVDAADLGDEEAELAVGDAEDHELLWYATQELGEL
jgi:hypothetical protein